MARSKKAALLLSEEDKQYLQKICNSRTEQVRRVERATILLHYADGMSSPQIAKRMGISVPNTDTCIKKALQFGVRQALEDFKRSGRPVELTPEARAWIVSLACQKPKELGYSYELWTMSLLAQHVRQHAMAEGHPSAARMAKGTVSRILSSHDLKPHKVSYYVERRDPDFDTKRAQVLHVYQQVEWKIENDNFQMSCDVVVSYDEKPGIQAIGTTSLDLPPVPGEHPTISRDYEYVRHGTVTLMAAIDLVSGEVLGSVVDRHRSREFVDFLKMLDTHYEPDLRIQVVLDNHSAHTSKETRAYLDTVPNRFEFVFTPKHGSWLNVIETFFSKMSRSFLRGIRVASKEELKERIELYLKEINANPIPFRWKYGMESAAK
ncbi:IS630 family transposase [Fodinisporobacter ferrooxydans]|uniref:IS630 family transposase n=1 Tax=Fodinisporobacter ferrooxydans TaxID=2901836 RepID=A0ABY4CHU5_9BACL|nr:IS630 family transposase [Alicyclobacillaceae bacterium MYW30-H2]